MARKKTEEQTVTQEVTEVTETGDTVDSVEVHEVVKDSDEADITEDDATEEKVSAEEGQHEGKEKVKLISLPQLEQALIELGVDLATGIKDRTRHVTSQETESINALCNIYNTLVFKK